MRGEDLPIDPKRKELAFASSAITAFAFLAEKGFVLIDALPTIVRFERGDLCINTTVVALTRWGSRLDMATRCTAPRRSLNSQSAW